MSKDERKDFYRTIAWGLNRPLFAVYRRVLRMYDDRNHVGKYTPEEIEKLKEQLWTPKKGHTFKLWLSKYCCPQLPNQSNGKKKNEE